MGTENIHSVEVSPGVVVDSSMTSEQRFNIIAKSLGAPTVERPVSTPQFHVDSTIATFKQQEQAAKVDHKAISKLTADYSALPSEAREGARAQYEANLRTLYQGQPVKPAPSKREAQQPLTVERFDAEMRAQGIQKPLDNNTTVRDYPAVSPNLVDQALLTQLNNIWRNLTPAEREERRAIYENDLKTVFEGRRSGESLQAFYSRMNNGTNAVPSYSEPTSEQRNAAIDAAAKASDSDGFAPATSIPPALLHGYAIPQNKEFHVAELVSGLRLARRGNLSQQQVDRIIQSASEEKTRYTT